MQNLGSFYANSHIRTGSCWHKHFLHKAERGFNGWGYSDEYFKPGVLTPVPKVPSCLPSTLGCSFLTLYHAFLWAIAAVYPASSEGEEATASFAHRAGTASTSDGLAADSGASSEGYVRQTRRGCTTSQKWKFLACVFGWNTVELGGCSILPLRNR